MKLLTTIAIVIALQSLVLCSHDEWLKFKEKYGKKYANEAEENRRSEIFHNNLELIKKHNQKYQNGEVTFEMGVNSMADFLPEEIIPKAYVQPEFLSFLFGSIRMYKPDPNFIPPKEVDWRKEGAVTRVKYQGFCGSCWAFAAVGALEAAHFRRTGELVELSEQNLLDCSFYNPGCLGGLAMNAYKAVKKFGGIDTERSYPYTGYRTKCRFNSSSSVMKIKEVLRVQSGNEDHLKHAVAELGPVSVRMAAEFQFMKYTGGGVFSSAFCGLPLIPNHEVLIVGYGEDLLGGEYWLIKNSFGEAWGHGGYMKIKRGDNMCQIASIPTIPIAE